MRIAQADRITNLSSLELAEAELQMLEMITPIAQTSRVEFLANLSLRQNIHNPVSVGWGEQHEIWLDAFGPDLYGVQSFRYGMTGTEDGTGFIASNYHGTGISDKEIRSVEEKLMTGADGTPLLLTKTDYRAGGEAVNIDELEEVSTQDILRLLQDGIDFCADTGRWPRLRDAENPVLGMNYGNPEPLIDPSEVLPMYAQVVQSGVEAMRAAGNDTAADIDLHFDVGKQLNQVSMQHPATIALWSRNANRSAEFECAVKGFDRDLAFLSADLRVKEYQRPGIKVTHHHVWQHGDQLQLRIKVCDEDPVASSVSVDLAVVTQLAAIVTQIARNEDITDFTD